MERPGAQFRIIAQGRSLSGKQMLNDLTCFPPGRATEREKSVQRIAIENRSGGEFRRAEVTALFEQREVEDEIANGDAGARRALVRLENPEREIFERKMRFRRDLDKGTKRSRHELWWLEKADGHARVAG